VVFYTFEPKIRRTDAARNFNLLTLESRDKESPLLPLSQATTVSSLNEIHPEVAASLMGAGPWTLQLALKVSNGSGTLHFSNKNRRGPIQISHSLTIVIRVERGDDEHLDPKTGKRKRFDVVLQMPVHILSVLYHPALTNKHDILTVHVHMWSLESVVGKHAARCAPTLHREGRGTAPTTRSTHLLEPSVLSTSLASHFCAAEFDYRRAVRAIRLARGASS
jgi:hypothetical protein